MPVIPTRTAFPSNNHPHEQSSDDNDSLAGSHCPRVLDQVERHEQQLAKQEETEATDVTDACDVCIRPCTSICLYHGYRCDSAWCMVAQPVVQLARRTLRCPRNAWWLPRRVTHCVPPHLGTGCRIQRGPRRCCLPPPPSHTRATGSHHLRARRPFASSQVWLAVPGSDPGQGELAHSQWPTCLSGQLTPTK